jgi:hypothetical protein
MFGISFCQSPIALNTLFKLFVRLEYRDSSRDLFSEFWEQENLNVNIIRYLKFSGVMIGNKLIWSEIESPLVLARAISRRRKVVDMHLLLCMIKFEVLEQVSLLVVFLNINQRYGKLSLHLFLLDLFSSVSLQKQFLLRNKKLKGAAIHSPQLLS